jgi:hypothetical protein
LSPVPVNGNAAADVAMGFGFLLLLRFFVVDVFSQ